MSSSERIVIVLLFYGAAGIGNHAYASQVISGIIDRLKASSLVSALKPAPGKVSPIKPHSAGEIERIFAICQGTCVNVAVAVFIFHTVLGTIRQITVSGNDTTVRFNALRQVKNIVGNLLTLFQKLPLYIIFQFLMPLYDLRE